MDRGGYRVRHLAKLLQAEGRHNETLWIALLMTFWEDGPTERRKGIDNHYISITLRLFEIGVMLVTKNCVVFCSKRTMKAEIQCRVLTVKY